MALPTRDGRSTRWDAHREQRRAELIEAALVAVERHGPEVTADQIAAAAGISRPLLYRHFDDLAALQRAIAGRAGESLTAELAVALDPAAPAEEIVQTACRAFMTWVAENAPLARYMLRHFGQSSDLINGVRDQAVMLTAAALGHTLLIGAEPCKVTALAHALVGMSEATAINWLASEDPETLPKLIDGLARWGAAAIDTERPA